MAPDILTPSQVAGLFHVHPTTVRRWALDGRIAYFKTPGGHMRFRRSDLEAWQAPIAATKDSAA